MIKKDEELELLKESASIAKKAHDTAMQCIRPGLYEYEVEAMFLSEFRKSDAYEGYPSIVAAGNNACILHYTSNQSKLCDGDLILIDAGAEKNLMNTDVTRTFPVGKKWDPIAKEVYNIVLEAQNRAIAITCAGNTMHQIHKAALEVLIQGLVDLKVLHEHKSVAIYMDEAAEIESLYKAKKISYMDTIEKIPYKSFYPHSTSHFLGLDVHDISGTYALDKHKALEENMVITVEPGLYFHKDNDKVPAHLRGIGIRIEDDICIKKQKAWNVTEGIVKDVDKIMQYKK